MKNRTRGAVLVTIMLVFWMNAGFALVESGFDGRAIAGAGRGLSV